METSKILEYIALVIAFLYFLYIVGKLFIEFTPTIHHKIYYRLCVKLLNDKIRKQGQKKHLVETLKYYKQKLKAIS